MTGSRWPRVWSMPQVPARTSRAGVDDQPRVFLLLAHLFGDLPAGPTTLEAEAHPADRTPRRLRRPAGHLLTSGLDGRLPLRTLVLERVRYQPISRPLQALRF